MERQAYLDKKELQSIKRGDVVLVDLGTNRGSEQSNLRPCLVIQNDMGNRFSTTTIIVPITGSDKKEFPVHVKINKSLVLKGEVYGTIMCEQIRVVDKARITKTRIAKLSNHAMGLVDKALMQSIGLS